MIELVTNNHMEIIEQLFDDVSEKITIISPFLNEKMAEKLCYCVKEKNIDCNFITRIYLEDMVSNVNSIKALEMMLNAGIKVYAQKWLHTKLYLFDDNVGIIGSANFTTGGFKSNIELSIMVKEEPEFLKKMTEYCENEIKSLNNKEGIVTKKLLSEVFESYKNLISKKAKDVAFSNKMYGADTKNKIFTPDIEKINKEANSGVKMAENDIMLSVFREIKKDIEYDNNIWLKFDGSGDDRIEPNEKIPMTAVNYKGKKVYIQNYPFGVKSIKDGDYIYLAAITKVEGSIFEHQPVICGKAIAVVDGDDKIVPQEWINEYDYMEKYNYFCVISNIKIIDANVSKGIPLSEVWAELGADTYKSSFGTNQTIKEISKKHYQKAHLLLSGKAKDYLDKRLDKLFDEYGIIDYPYDN